MNTKLCTLRDGLLDEVRDLYSAERQLVKALPKLVKKATNQKLKDALSAHLKETEGHVERLEEIGKLLEMKLSGKTCKAMQGLIEEGSDVIERESENEALLDVLLIGAAQRVEHYEMAAYGTAHAIALELGQVDIAALLEETLQEERNADRKLASISKDELLSEAHIDSSIDEEEQDAKHVPMQKSRNHKKVGNAARLLALASCLVLSDRLATSAFADTASSKAKNESEAKDYKSDNTGRNVRDRNDSRVTADDQKLGGSELAVLAQIRREIVANKDLSTNAHNVKIVVENGKVMLRGPVKSAQEKSWIQATTARLATGYSVVNQLEVAPG